MKRPLEQIADEVARALSYARVSGTAAFITTPIMYANGTVVVVRVDEAEDGYFVSDDGGATLAAELLGALPTFLGIAKSVGARAGVEFDQRAYFVLRVTEEQLVGAVAIIANTSALAVEKLIFALDQVKVKRSRVTFEERLRTAFGPKVRFEAEVRGTSRPWRVDGLVLRPDGSTSVFEFVSPAFAAIASAHMKLGDIRALDDGPTTVAVLADYAKTEAPLRAILSSATDRVISAEQSPDEYLAAA